MSKETERLFIPGYIYLIMPDRSMYIFADKAGQSAELTVRQKFLPEESLYCKNNKTASLIKRAGYAVYLLQSNPDCFIKTDNPEIFSAHRKEIERWFKSQE